MDTWRTWQLVLPALERRHDVLAVTMAGHLGGPPLPDGGGADAVLDAVEQAMDEAGFATAHVLGNSLGGYVALKLAERDRARSVVALAPAGGWAAGDDSYRALLREQEGLYRVTRLTAANADAVVATPEGRRRVSAMLSERWEHIPPDLLADLIRAVAGCSAAPAMVAGALRDGWPLDASRVRCPVRIVWGLADRLLPWPRAAARWRAELPQADWVELDGVGHCPQLDVPLETAQLVLGFTT